MERAVILAIYEKSNSLINCEKFPVTREFGARRGDPNVAESPQVRASRFDGKRLNPA
jgi:hypothetical protein